MKNVFIIVMFFLCFVGCEKEPSNNIQDKKFFDSKELSKLSLENIDEFWGNEKLIYLASYFKKYPSYISDTGLYVLDAGLKNVKGISVTVFESQEKAIECMEARISTVSSVIKKGNNVELEGAWWYSDSSGGYKIFKNQWNTIIELYWNNVNFEEKKPVLFSTVNIVALRIDKLGIVIK